MNRIEVENLTKDYKNGRGIFGLDFSVGRGEVFGYLGPNGAGKTTTIRCLMGFIKAGGGSCRINGMDCFEHSRQIHKNVGYLPGEIALINDMTGRQYLKFIREMKGIKDSRRQKYITDLFELDDSGKIKKMSKGTKQKVALAAAFMGQPDILVLDEATSGLDPLMQNRFVDLVLEEKKRGRTIFMSSHIFEEVEKTCDRVAIIKDGRLVSVESMAALATKKQKSYTVLFKDRRRAAAFASKAPFAVEKVQGARVHFYAGQNPGAVLAAVARADPVDIEIKSQSLEELFLHFYKEGDR